MEIIILWKSNDNLHMNHTYISIYSAASRQWSYLFIFRQIRQIYPVVAAVTPKAHVLFRSLSLRDAVGGCVAFYTSRSLHSTTHTCCMAGARVANTKHARTQWKHMFCEHQWRAAAATAMKKKNAENQTTHARTYNSPPTSPILLLPRWWSLVVFLPRHRRMTICGGDRFFSTASSSSVAAAQANRAVSSFSPRSQSTHLHRRVKSQKKKTYIEKDGKIYKNFLCPCFSHFCCCIFRIAAGSRGCGHFQAQPPGKQRAH